MSKHDRRLVPNYFQKHRPQGDSIKAKVARSQQITAERPVTLPRIWFLELSGRELWSAVASEKRGRS